MKLINSIFCLLLTLAIVSSCTKEEDSDTEPKRSTQLVTLNNNTSNTTGCSTQAIKVTFIISYRDIQAEATINAGSRGFVNVLVEDGEKINVLVQRTSDDEVIADADVSVRTSSRPEHLEDEGRAINFCYAFDLTFANF